MYLSINAPTRHTSNTKSHPDVSVNADGHQLAFVQQDLHDGSVVAGLATPAGDLDLDELVS